MPDSNDSELQTPDAVLNAFLDQLLDDQASGVVRDVEGYRKLFPPQHRDLVAREFARYEARLAAVRAGGRERLATAFASVLTARLKRKRPKAEDQRIFDSLFADDDERRRFLADPGAADTYAALEERGEDDLAPAEASDEPRHALLAGLPRTGREAVDALLLCSTLLRLGAVRDAQAELTAFPADATPLEDAWRHLLLAECHVRSGDRARFEASKAAALSAAAEAELL